MQMDNKQSNNQGIPSEFKYEDSEDWRGSNDSFSIKEIALRQFNRAMLEGVREMTSGGVKNRLVDGQIMEFVVPNQKEIFINAVEMAFMPLRPYVSKCSDESIKDKFKTYDESIKQLNKNYTDTLVSIRKEYDSKIGIGKDFSNEYNLRVRNVANNFENAKVSLSKQLLEAISYLLFDLDYFGETGVLGGEF